VTVWTERDLPVLRFVADQLGGGSIFATAWCDNERRHPDLPGLGVVDVEYSIDTLVEAGYVSFDDREPNAVGETFWIGLAATGQGLRTLGEWPTLAGVDDPTSFAALLAALHGKAADPEQARALETVSRQVGKLSLAAFRGALVGAATTLARARLGV